MDARSWANLDHVIRTANRVLVVLNYEDRIAEIAEIFECFDQAFVIALMQTDRRLVEHIHRSYEVRADL